ncbi:hypothetical protein [Nocardia salmonicida]|uniref:hypothetical protein n=1 Tax=Nocardia salmonicida TaxID=53431 RepID=UPI00362B767D
MTQPQTTTVTPEQIRARFEEALAKFPAGVPIPVTKAGIVGPESPPAAEPVPEIPFVDFPAWRPPSPEAHDETEVGDPIAAPDHPGRTAELWSAYLGTPITRLDVDNLHALGEIARSRAEQDITR